MNGSQTGLVRWRCPGPHVFTCQTHHTSKTYAMCMDHRPLPGKVSSWGETTQPMADRGHQPGRPKPQPGRLRNGLQPTSDGLQPSIAIAYQKEKKVPACRAAHVAIPCRAPLHVLRLRKAELRAAEEEVDIQRNEINRRRRCLRVHRLHSDEHTTWKWTTHEGKLYSFRDHFHPLPCDVLVRV